MSNFNVDEQLARIPAQPIAATLILRLLQDPNALPSQLGRLIEMDPALSARVIRLANSPHNARRSEVGSAARAVVLLGYSTVRGIAAAAASTLLAGDVNLGPQDHWAHSVSVAAGASVAAGVLDVAENEAFSAGLLHDIGRALLHGAGQDRYEAMLKDLEPGGLRDAEWEAFGTTHPDAGAAALELWQFPDNFVEAVRTHHYSVRRVNPLAQAIILGEALAERVQQLSPDEAGPDLEMIIDELGLEPSIRGSLIARTREEIKDISRFLEADE